MASDARRIRADRRTREQRGHLSRGRDARRRRGTLKRGYEHQRQGRFVREPGRAADHDRAATRRHRQFGIDGGKIGSRANLPYNASKAAVISMTKSLAITHAADGIRVNCMCPGFVETDMWTSAARAGSAAQPIARKVYPPTHKTDPLGPHGEAGRRRQRRRVPRVVTLGVHDGSGPQRRRWLGDARVK